MQQMIPNTTGPTPACLTPSAFSSEGSLKCQRMLRHVVKVNTMRFDKGVLIMPILVYVLGLTLSWLTQMGLELLSQTKSYSLPLLSLSKRFIRGYVYIRHTISSTTNREDLVNSWHSATL
jgi:hypothetical protein